MQNLISLDWLTVNYLCSENTEYLLQFPKNQAFKIEKKPYSTRHFRDIFEVFFGGQIVATIIKNPLSDILDKRLTQVKFSNQLFYQFIDRIILQQLKECLELTYLSLSRIDVCIDVECFPLNDFVDKLRNFKIKMKSKRKTQEYYTMNSKNEVIEYEGIKFGTNISAYTFKIYNKSKEIREESYKWYIQDWWAANGWCRQTDVYRLEFSIMEIDKLCTTDGIIIDDMSIFDFEVKSLILHNYLDKVATYWNTGKTRIDREERYYYVELPPYDGIKLKNAKNKGQNIRTAKILCNMLCKDLKDNFMPAKIAGYKWMTLQRLIQEYGIVEWFEYKYPELEKDMMEKYPVERLALCERLNADIFAETKVYREL